MSFLNFDWLRPQEQAHPPTMTMRPAPYSGQIEGFDDDDDDDDDYDYEQEYLRRMDRQVYQMHCEHQNHVATLNAIGNDYPYEENSGYYPSGFEDLEFDAFPSGEVTEGGYQYGSY